MRMEDNSVAYIHWECLQKYLQDYISISLSFSSRHEAVQSAQPPAAYLKLKHHSHEQPDIRRENADEIELIPPNLEILLMEGVEPKRSATLCRESILSSISFFHEALLKLASEDSWIFRRDAREGVHSAVQLCYC